MSSWMRDADMGSFDGAEDHRTEGHPREFLERYSHVYRACYAKAYRASVRAYLDGTRELEVGE